MPTLIELADRLKDPLKKDKVMMDVADYYIHQPGVDTDELVRMTVIIPFINGLRVDVIEKAIDRFQMANEMLPNVKVFVGNFLKIIGFDGVGGMETLKVARDLAAEEPEFAGISFNTMHLLLAREKELAEQMNQPLREFQAALARVGIETCVGILLNSQDLEIRRLAKQNLLYFADIEMLSIGVRTNAYTLSFANPAKVNPRMLQDGGTIMPLLNVEGDKALRGALALGQLEVSEIVSSGVPGLNVLRIT